MARANGLARHIYGSIDIDHALDIIASDNVSDCDYGTVTGGPFFCTFGLGFDAKVSKEFSSMSRRACPYIKSAVQEYVRYSPAEYEIHTGEQTLRFVHSSWLSCNAPRSMATMRLSPQSLRFRTACSTLHTDTAGNPLTRALAGVELFTGASRPKPADPDNPGARPHASGISSPAHIDGDGHGPQTLTVMCQPGDIRMFTDPRKPPLPPVHHAH